MTQALLAQAIEAIRSGDKVTGQKLLAQVLRADPRSENAWLWMSQIVETDQQRLDCLRRIIAINPDNAAARKGIALLESRSGAAAPAHEAPKPPPPPVPEPDWRSMAPAFVEPEPEPELEPFVPVYEEPIESEPEIGRDEFPTWEEPQVEDLPSPPVRSRLSEIRSAPAQDVISSLRGGSPLTPEVVEEQEPAEEPAAIPASRFAFVEAEVETPRERRPFPISRRAMMRVVLLLVVVAIIGVAATFVLPRLSAPHATPVPAAEVGRLVVVAGQGETSQIALLQSDGSGLTPITNQPGAKSDPVWSADGKRIAFVDNDQIAVIDANGQGHSLLTQVDAHNADPAWSPDGTRIAFASDREGDFDIFVMAADGSGAFNLTRFKGDDRHPLWTPDGQSIIFQSDRAGQNDIYSMHIDGSNVTALTHDRADEIEPALSFDGAQIAYVRAGDASDAIYVMNSDGSNTQAVTQDDTHKRRPAWTTSGKILYTVVDGDAATLFIVNVDGSDAQSIASNTSAAGWQPVDVDPSSIAAAPAPTEATQSSGPATQPAGKIYFTADSDLYVMNPDGSGARALTNTTEDEVHPSVTFISGRIAYDVPVSVTQQLFAANLDGSNPITLTESNISVRRPIWSPDETRLVYEVDGDRGPDLAVLNIDGSGASALTTRPGYDGCATWNPTSTQLAFTSDRDGGMDIYVMNADGSGVQRLTRHRAIDRCPAWSPDGTSFAFLSDRDGEGVYLMSSDGADVHLLVAIRSASQPSWSRDGRFLLVASDQTGNSEIYLISVEEKALWNLTNTSDVDEVDPVWGP